MAACHLRSISLPSSRSHPVNESIEEQINKLKASKSILKKVNGLKNLYEFVDDLLQLSSTQQTLSNESESAEEALNESLRLLDICGTTRDVLSQIKESIQELESSLRRKRSGESGLTSEVDKYISSRKSLNKLINKSLKTLKRKEKSNSTIVQLRDVEEISFQVFQSILCIVSYETPKQGWSTVSKLLQSKRVSCESNIEANKTKKIDMELLTLKSSKAIDSLQVQTILKGLEAFESTIQEMEEELECTYRRLVKARVSLLNILNC